MNGNELKNKYSENITNVNFLFLEYELSYCLFIQ